MACLSDDTSIIAHIKYATMPTNKGRKSIFVIIASMKLSWLAKIKDLVRPQPGQGMPVSILKKQGTEKGVLVVRNKNNTPIP